MRLLILRDSRITVKAGETVEVSPVQANFLMSTGSAMPAPAESMRETPEQEAQKETRKASAKTMRKK